MPIVTLPGGQVRDEIRQPIYDTIDLTPAVSPVGTTRFFSNVQGKSLAKTNLRQNNLLETAVSFRIQGLCLDSQNDNIANAGVLSVLMIRSSLRLHVGEKDYWSGCSRYAAGRMWSMAETTVAATSVLLQQYGFSAIQPVVFQGKHVIDINPLQSFFAEWVIDPLIAVELAAATPAAATTVSFAFSLKGLQRRPVQ
jgi:hypothetical protein